MSDLSEWLEERRDQAIYAPISVEADNYGSARFVCDGWPIPAHGSHATAIVDAHNTLPALLTAVEKVLEVLDAGVRDGDSAELIRSVALMEIEEAIEGAINDDE